MYHSRFLYSASGVLADYSKELSDFQSGSASFTVDAANDYVYLGSDFPFNHRYIEVETGNVSGSVVSVDIWDGTNWKPCVDVQDETVSGGACLGQSGIISWVVDKDYGWERDDTNEDSDTVTGLTSVNIYDQFWTRLRLSASTSALSVKYCGYRFADDDDLKAYYPDLVRSDVLSQFATGKTSWNEQHVYAAEAILRHLRSRNLIYSSNQVLMPSVFNEAAIYKVASIIMGAFGINYREAQAEADRRYAHAIKQSIAFIDENMNGRLDVFERKSKQGFLTR